MSARILIVDDEEAIVEIIESNLERESYEVDKAYNGDDALELALANNYDLILLDCMLPGMDGFDVCRKLRQTKTTPIIMITAKGDEIDKVLGLELGADDYLTKPFGMRELLARVKAQLRRNALVDNTEERSTRETNELEVADLLIDYDTYDVSRAGKSLNLTPREFQLFVFLAEEPGRVFTREEILKEVWGVGEEGDTRTVDVTVRRVREKIEPQGADFKYILTKRSVGYYFNKDI